MDQTKFHAVMFFFALCLVIGCTSYNDYSTDPDECYYGEIIEAVRSGAFSKDVKMTLGLDVNALGSGEKGAWITTSDGKFKGSPARQLEELIRDPLSMLHFPGGRIRSYFAYAPGTDGSIATIIISLMEDESVEVRIIRPELEPDGGVPDGGVDGSLFGVFRLIRVDDCAAPRLQEP